MKYSIEKIIKACNGKYLGDNSLLNREVTAFVTDSRLAGEACAYVALVGERVDGHRFIKDTFSKGAYLSIGEQDYEPCEGEAYIKTASSLEALGSIASAYMNERNLPVVGVTGSVGKTGTKEMIASVLSTSMNVAKTKGNHNNEIGLPLTCLETPDDAQVSVLEMGISAPGEMDYLINIIQPKVAVVTNIGVSHMEILGSKEGIYKEKIKIAGGLPDDGLLVINGDDEFLSAVKNEDIATHAPVKRFGFDRKNDIYADDVRTNGLESTSFKIFGLQCAPDGIDVSLKLPGRHLILNALAAAAVGDHFGLTAGEIVKGIESAGTIKGRMNVIKAHGITVIDDAYNASPVSMKAAIEALSQAGGRKICVLGDMFELGDESDKMHYEVGRFAAEKGVCVLFVCGEQSVEIAKGALGVNPDADIEGCAQEEHIEVMMSDPQCPVVPEFYIFKENDRMIKKIKEVVRPGDTVLVKASNSMRFSEVVEGLSK